MEHILTNYWQGFFFGAFLGAASMVLILAYFYIKPWDE
jgi:Mg2+ and Co2+ transporter CorA